jgi:hypothetical protein
MDKMVTRTMEIVLLREIGVGMEVLGTLIVKGQLGSNNTVLTTIENKHYLFNDGIYKIRYEYSPKFDMYLWEFINIKGRSEIKFHTGRSASDSKGCVLLGDTDLDNLHSALDSDNTYQIKVKSKQLKP